MKKRHAAAVLFADFASLVRKFLETEGHFEKLNFSCFYFPKRPVSAAVSKFYSADFGLYLFYLHKV